MVFEKNLGTVYDLKYVDETDNERGYKIFVKRGFYTILDKSLIRN